MERGFNRGDLGDLFSWKRCGLNRFKWDFIQTQKHTRVDIIDTGVTRISNTISASGSTITFDITIGSVLTPKPYPANTTHPYSYTTTNLPCPSTEAPVTVSVTTDDDYALESSWFIGSPDGTLIKRSGPFSYWSNLCFQLVSRFFPLPPIHFSR